MNFSELFTRAGLTLRDIQQEYALAVYAGLGVKGRVALLSADTGVGKTLGYLVAALRIIKNNPDAQFVIATSTHALMTQIMSHDSRIISHMADMAGIPDVMFSRLLGKANYVSPEKVRHVIQAYPASLSDDLRVLNALAKWHGPLVEFEEEYGALPEGITADAVTWSMWDSVEYIRDIQKEAVKARFVVTSHAMVMLDSLNRNSVFGDKENRYLIIDEADMFADMTELYQQRRLNLYELQHALAQHLTPARMKNLAAVADKVCDIAGDLHFLRDTGAVETYRSAVEELLWIGNTIKDDDAREKFTASLFSWVPAHLPGGHTGIGVSRTRKEPALIQINPFVARNVGEYTGQWESVVMTSATLSITGEPSRGMEWIVSTFGLAEERISLRDIFTPRTYGEMALTIAGKGFADIFSDAQERSLSEAWLTQVADVVKRTAVSGPVVVLTASHDESGKIADRLRDIMLPVYVQNAGQPVSEIIREYVKKPGILISAGAFVGLSLRKADGGQLFQDLIITRMRFAPPDREGAESYHQYLRQLGYAKTVQSITRSNYISQLQKVVRKGKQAIGRGIRSENDVIRLTILDPRFPEPKDISSKYRALENIIPARFAGAYRHCTILSPAAESTEEIIC
ncbi:DEAD/DEAH box helicase [Salmonella enterica]|nr:DEAD/DEAH box helicase [Salmonella enterica]EKT1325841.1 DEAD/DEAH box helicase [Salmonella enterica]EKT1358935.1 DEAD/DEAH box helicase [Salmonella enterica]EKT2635433.1 DEAD/DEAH box helicase [Salmonella enterica]EKT3223959.1 DEAD/DEAH box helicase [Salmonella enterica]